MKKVSVYVWDIINVRIDDVWNLVKDFTSLDRWHPYVESCNHVGAVDANQIGCERKFIQVGGAVVQEKLLTLDDSKFSTSYTVLSAPAPFSSYVAEIKLVEENERTVFQWKADFLWPDYENADEIRENLENVFKMGIDNVALMLAHQPREAVS